MSDCTLHRDSSRLCTSADTVKSFSSKAHIQLQIALPPNRSVSSPRSSYSKRSAAEDARGLSRCFNGTPHEHTRDAPVYGDMRGNVVPRRLRLLSGLSLDVNSAASTTASNSPFWSSEDYSPSVINEPPPPVTVSPVTVSPVTVSPVTVSTVTASPLTASPVTAPLVTVSPVTVSPVAPTPVTPSPETSSSLPLYNTPPHPTENGYHSTAVSPGCDSWRDSGSWHGDKMLSVPVTVHKSWNGDDIINCHERGSSRRQTSQPGPQPVKAKHQVDMSNLHANFNKRTTNVINRSDDFHYQAGDKFNHMLDTQRHHSFSHMDRKMWLSSRLKRQDSTPAPSAPNWKYGNTIYEALNGKNGTACFDLHDCNDDLVGSEGLDSGGDDLDGYSPRSFPKHGPLSRSPRSDRVELARNNYIRHRSMSEDVSITSSQVEQLNAIRDRPMKKQPLPKVRSAPIDVSNFDQSQSPYARKGSAHVIKAHMNVISDNLGSLMRSRPSLSNKKASSSISSTGSGNSSCGFSSAQNSDSKNEPSTPPVNLDFAFIDASSHHHDRHHHRPRSNSVPSVLELRQDDSDSDVDNDDFGFLSYPSFRLRVQRQTSQGDDACADDFSAMRKTSPGAISSKTVTAVLSNPNKKGIIPKRWIRSKTSSASKVQSSWRPEGSSCTWSDKSGNSVTTQQTSLLRLTDAERVFLQKIALAKLNSLNLGCQITIPKEWCHKRSKRSGFSLKRRTGSSSLLENLREKTGKENKDCGSWVFGIPLGKVIANDLELRRRRPSMLRERRESSDVTQRTRGTRKSSSSSGSDSISDMESRGGGTNLLDALSLSSTADLEETQAKSDRERSLIIHSPKVPYIVNTCCKHLETYGLQVLGIFRVGSSKKRSKQLRDDFNSGRYVKLSDEHNPHDVGAVLKEFFRDLADPLLTRDLYAGFIASRKLATHEERVHVLHLLVSLLPPCNRDTLWMLLRFLRLVSQHSTDSMDQNAQTLPGNKMDTHNLATIFGPNLLHKAKGGEYQVECLERAEERKEIIEVIKDMINHHETIFQLSSEGHQEALRLLYEADPEAADILLDRMRTSSTSEQRMEVDVESPEKHMSAGSPASVAASHGITVDVEPPQPSLNDNVFLPSAAAPQFPGSSLHPSVTRRQSERQPHEASGHMLRVPNSSWHRSPSPSSPRVSPRPKAFKAATPDLRIRVIPSDQENPSTAADVPGRMTQALVSPRPNRLPTKTAASSSSGASPVRATHPSLLQSHSPNEACKRNLLTVPASKTKNSGSVSSLSSGYVPGSSRSGTNSPSFADPLTSSHQSWYLETPPDSPHRKQAQEEAFSREVHATSSTHRPLGIHLSEPTTSTSDSDHWQRDDWQHWKQIAKDRSDDFHEQETLV